MSPSRGWNSVPSGAAEQPHRGHTSNAPNFAAAAASLALQEAATEVVAARPDWPRLRVGVNSGQATVSLLGTEGGRTHTVAGDVVNAALRIEGKAPDGRSGDRPRRQGVGF